MCYCCHEQHMRGSRRVRAVQTYLTAERAESFLNAAAVGQAYRHRRKDSFIFRSWKVTTAPQYQSSSFEHFADHTACLPPKHELFNSILHLWEIFRAQLGESTWGTMAFPRRQWKDPENVGSSGDTSMSCCKWDLWKAFKCVFVEPLTRIIDPPAGTFISSSAESERVGQKWRIVMSGCLFCVFFSFLFHV